jgi:glycosyltransferase involved in cell wall biosynthesis
MVGRLVKQKNYMQAINVFKNISGTNELHIYGAPGDAENEIDLNLKSENKYCLIKKFSPTNKINLVYNTFDIFLMTSNFEGCPNALFEALLSKCFCIISKNANTDSFIRHGYNGFVYNGSDEDLLLKLNTAISIHDSKDFTEIIENGYQYALNNFSMDRMVKSYENLYFKVLSSFK